MGETLMGETPTATPTIRTARGAITNAARPDFTHPASTHEGEGCTDRGTHAAAKDLDIGLDTDLTPGLTSDYEE